MATKRQARGPQQSPQKAAKKIIYANDTSGTVPSTTKKRATSTTATLNDFPDDETYELEDDLRTDDELPASGDAAWKWILDHWEVPTSLLAIAATILIFATKLDAKVEVLSGDVKEVKTNLERLTTEGTRTSTEIGHLQRSISRLEDQKRGKN